MATMGVYLIIFKEEGILFIVLVDFLIIKLLETYQVSIKAWYIGYS
jgi:hypothetical protein